MFVNRATNFKTESSCCPVLLLAMHLSMSSCNSCNHPAHPATPPRQVPHHFTALIITSNNINNNFNNNIIFNYSFNNNNNNNNNTSIRLGCALPMLTLVVRHLHSKVT